MNQFRASRSAPLPVVLISTGADPHAVTWYPPCRAFPLPVLVVADPGTDAGANGPFPPNTANPLICHQVTDPGGDPGAYGYFTPSAQAPVIIQQVAGTVPPTNTWYPPSFANPVPIILI